MSKQALTMLQCEANTISANTKRSEVSGRIGVIGRIDMANEWFYQKWCIFSQKKEELHSPSFPFNLNLNYEKI